MLRLGSRPLGVIYFVQRIKAKRKETFLSEIESITRKFTHWYIIAWIVLIPSFIFLISLPCYAPTSFSDTRNDAFEWISVIGIGLLSVNAIYISILEITFARINIYSWFTKTIAIVTLFLSIMFALIAIFVWYLSVFYPQIVSYFGEDPKGLPAFTLIWFIYIMLLVVLSFHTYRTQKHQRSESNST